MAFDKIKAMRNAERYLSQGKIRAAIGEYKEVVYHDPRDFGTMNLLGDLLTKASEPKAAVGFYTAVAEHYSKQGFAQKAIAVYNKISKLQPNSLAVSERLAELYKTKGSVTEAKSHYVVLAENYQAKGRTAEALAMWKQIALLDPTNTEVYTTIAEAHLKEGETDEAVEAFADAGERFMKREMFDRSRDSFLRGLGHSPSHKRCLHGIVEVEFAREQPEKAVEKLQEFAAADRSNVEALSALVDCHLRSDNAEEAENAVVRLVEQDPMSYPKLLVLANYYLAEGDNKGATRVLTMGSEHLLAGGRAEEFASAVRVILDKEPECLDAVRLLVRFSTWQRDEASLKDSLRKLAAVAREQESVEDERFALSQLVMFMPQEVAFADRLRDVNILHGFADEEPVKHSLFDQKFLKAEVVIEATPLDPQAGSSVPALSGEANMATGSFDTIHVVPHSDQSRLIENELTTNGEAISESARSLVEQSPTARVRRESDSIRFYIDSGYIELAEKAIEELKEEFGETAEVADLRAYLKGGGKNSNIVTEVSNGRNGSSNAFDIGEFRSELGLEDGDIADDADFETKYQTAIAYQEMGLLEQAIAEFQEAAGLVKPNDGTRRFFQCANLLGHCFMLNSMPKLALKWYERALNIKDLNADEKQALWYELGRVHEAEDDLDEAARFFELVYAENVDFRDVGERLKNMAVAG